MSGRAFATGAGVGAALLALLLVWLRSGAPRPPGGAAGELRGSDGVRGSKDDAARAAATARVPPGAAGARPAAVPSRDTPPAPPVAVPAASPRPEDGPEAASWRKAKLAFGPPEP